MTIFYMVEYGGGHSEKLGRAEERAEQRGEARVWRSFPPRPRQTEAECPTPHSICLCQRLIAGHARAPALPAAPPNHPAFRKRSTELGMICARRVTYHISR